MFILSALKALQICIIAMLTIAIMQTITNSSQTISLALFTANSTIYNHFFFFYNVAWKMLYMFAFLLSVETMEGFSIWKPE